MKYLLGLDFGGGASKATLLDETGVIAAESTVEYPTYYPEPGFCEQNPGDWYKAACTNIRSVLEKSGIDSRDILAVSFDAATHTAVLTDESFNVLMPSVYWTDTRCKKQAAAIADDEIILKQALHRPDTIWTLPQLMWIKENMPEIWKKTKRIMFAKDYVRHMFTGDYVTDCIEAEGSMLFDFNKMKWSEELCSYIGLDPGMLPRTVRPGDIAGTVSKAAAEQTGLPEGLTVLCGTTDTVMEVFASGAVEPGDTTVKLATAGRICVITEKPYPDKNLVNYSHVIDGLWYPGTATKSCAASFRWYRDTFGGGYGELDAGAEKIAAGADGLLFHPYLNGELTPYGDPQLCGSFTGIRAGHTKAHFTRAVLEGVAMSLLDCKLELERIGIPLGSAASIIGGGSKSPLWRSITADVLGISLIEKQCSDSSLGSAMLAGVTAGVFSDCRAAAKVCGKVVSETKPDMRRHEEYLKIFEKYKKIHDALAPVYHM